MGMLVDGVWQEQGRDGRIRDGRYQRAESQFRNSVTADGSSGFAAEPGRYHLYVSLACPWAHRTLILRTLKGLEDAISLSIVDAHMGKEGWVFSEAPGAIPDRVNGASRLSEVYLKAKRDYTGRVSVPVLWDKKRATIVNNESSEIVRMFNSAFDALPGVKRELDFYPEPLRVGIDEINAFVYERVNNGVYRAGFATTQAAYEEAFDALFHALDTLEARLERQRYLVGARMTEADWRLFTTLIRFDAVYVGHFKCNLRRIADYPNLANYTRELYQVPGVASTVDFDHIKRHYYGSHLHINPTGIVPKGPALDFAAAHDRARRYDVAA
ncbi:MAG TPA: glutathione S-transferase family protein [Alphaproteobacteria bacterium]|nr:glutathione S-transferase family protein [Alphaproteobacteria bacterium]